MTREIARAVAPGEVVGIDRFSVQFPAEAALPSNLRFREMDVYALDFPDAHFDGVFSHALFEHLSEPARALAEIRRVLKPGGFVALRSPDWGGFVLEPPGAAGAVADYRAIMHEYGGNPDTGRKLAGWLRAAGFHGVVPTAVYEIYDPPAQIAEFIAFQLDRGGKQASAKALRDWGSSPEALFGIAWFEALGFRAE